MKDISIREALRQALKEEMLRDDKVFILGEDIGLYGGAFKVTQGLLDEFGESRIIDTPISESALVGIAVGAALNGLRPIVEIMFGDLLALCMDHIINGAAMISSQYAGDLGCPMVIRTTTGISGGAGLHHSKSIESWFLNVPGLIVVTPSTPYDAKGLLKSSIREENPVLFLEHKYIYNVEGQVPEKEYMVPIGKADIKREGDDLTIVASSLMTHRSLEAHKKLQEDGINCEVIDLRTLFPLDENAIIGSIRKTGKLVVVQESPKAYGYGAEIAAIVAEKALEFLDAPIKRLANPGVHMPYTPRLEQAVVPSTEDIIRAVKEITS